LCVGSPESNVQYYGAPVLRVFFWSSRSKLLSVAAASNSHESRKRTLTEAGQATEARPGQVSYSAAEVHLVQ
jgi:hypothetical protein